MKYIALTAILFLAVFHAPGSASSEIAFADHLVVVTSNEAIHFRDAGDFYALKDLLENSIDKGKSSTDKGTQDQVIPVYLIGDGELKTLGVVSTWIRLDGSVYSMSGKAFDHFWDIVASRRGTGTRLDQLEEHLDFLVGQSRQEGGSYNNASTSIR